MSLNRFPAISLGRSLRLPMILVLSAAACSGEPAQPTDGRDSEPTPITAPAQPTPTNGMETLVLEPYSGLDDAGRQVVRDSAQWHRIWTAIHAGRSPQPQLPTVDFGTRMVLVASMGTRTSGGYRITIDSVTAGPAGIVAYVRGTRPDRSCIVPAAITAPVVAVAVPRREGTARFVEAETVIKCD